MDGWLDGRVDWHREIDRCVHSPPIHVTVFTHVHFSEPRRTALICLNPFTFLWSYLCARSCLAPSAFVSPNRSSAAPSLQLPGLYTNPGPMKCQEPCPGGGEPDSSTNGWNSPQSEARSNVQEPMSNHRKQADLSQKAGQHPPRRFESIPRRASSSQTLPPKHCGESKDSVWSCGWWGGGWLW